MKTKQQLISGNNIKEFTTKVNQWLELGWMVVPRTLVTNDGYHMVVLEAQVPVGGE